MLTRKLTLIEHFTYTIGASQLPTVMSIQATSWELVENIKTFEQYIGKEKGESFLCARNFASCGNLFNIFLKVLFGK